MGQEQAQRGFHAWSLHAQGLFTTDPQVELTSPEGVSSSSSDRHLDTDIDARVPQGTSRESVLRPTANAER